MSNWRFWFLDWSLLWFCGTDSPSGSCCRWLFSTDNSCRVGAQESHPCLPQGLMRRSRQPPRVLSTQRDKCVMLLLSSHRVWSLCRGRSRATEGRWLWERCSSETESGMCWGTRYRPVEEQFNSTGSRWQVQTSGHSGGGARQ